MIMMNTKGTNMKQKIDTQKLHKVAFGMAEMAKNYPNDMIANNLARVSEKVAAYGAAWSEKLDDLDMKIIRFYLQKTA
jgi:hypothetical protein